MKLKKYHSNIIAASVLMAIAGGSGYAQKQSSERASALASATSNEARDERLRFRGLYGSGAAESMLLPIQFGPKKNLR